MRRLRRSLHLSYHIIISYQPPPIISYHHIISTSTYPKIKPYLPFRSCYIAFWCRLLSSQTQPESSPKQQRHSFLPPQPCHRCSRPRSPGSARVSLALAIPQNRMRLSASCRSLFTRYVAGVASIHQSSSTAAPAASPRASAQTPTASAASMQSPVVTSPYSPHALSPSAFSPAVYGGAGAAAYGGGGYGMQVACDVLCVTCDLRLSICRLCFRRAWAAAFMAAAATTATAAACERPFCTSLTPLPPSSHCVAQGTAVEACTAAATAAAH
jgi:hypothetical protein